ncbi:TraM recognition domain-containing protein [Sutcliffiella horikoshii]|uniref:TraM recognition domain-containing protein n=1 Tax=Sutcliffiella horikoshii TaxID=79883 RepID=UPI001CBB23FB|nr:TraM recognition domain-containing protein [Sutcliffiella horikoshii]
MNDKENWWKKNWPFVLGSVLFAHSAYQLIKALVNQVVLINTHINGERYSIFLMGDPLYPSKVASIIIIFVIIYSWLFSTRLLKFQPLAWRLTQFLIMLGGVVGHFLWHVTANTYQHVIPYFETRLTEVFIDHTGMRSVLINNTEHFFWLLVSLPYMCVFLVLLYIGGLFTKDQNDIVEAFREFKWSGRWLQKISDVEKREVWPDVELGPDIVSKEIVVQPGRDRTLNGIIIGSIGTGKTAALALPKINQDLHHMTKFINSYPRISQLENYHSEEVKGMYLNGISIIEPSNDLCQKAFQLVQAHNIPEQSITYINPLDKNTPSINPMKGPVDKVAEAFAMVIEGLNESGDGGNFFFEQSQRNHLKHYIYLLKLHDPEKEVTFDMLLDMYNNSQLVRRMHVLLKARIPKDIDSMEDRDDRNHWKIVQQIDEWFDQNLLPKTIRTPQGEITEKIQEGEYRGEDKYYDAKAEYVQGLRNILNDVGANPLIRRVLFGKSDFDFDQHLEAGGVLLVNTAKGELSGLANVLGKIVLLSLQNAVFRRPPNTSTFHHILIDEAPDYLYQPFREFPAQSRKYKVIVTVIMQTIAQLADRYGEHYMETLIGTLRNRFVYGDLPAFDSQYFSKMFGEKWEYEESTNEMSVSPLQDNPMTRAGSTFQKVRDVALTEAEIMFQREFECAVKIVANNRPMPVRRIKANFVPKEQFKKADILVDDDAAAIWLEERAGITSDPIDDVINLEPIENDLEGIPTENSTTEPTHEPATENQQVFEEEVEKSISQRHDEMPKDSVVYTAPPTSRLRSKTKQYVYHESPEDEQLIQGEEEVAATLQIINEKDTPTVPETIEETVLSVASTLPNEPEEKKQSWNKAVDVEPLANWSQTLKSEPTNKNAIEPTKEKNESTKLPPSPLNDKEKDFLNEIVKFIDE